MCVKYLVDLWNEVMTWCHTTIAAPTLLSATFNPPDIDLIWVDNANNNTCFNIWRSTDGTNFVLIDTIGDLESYTDTTAMLGVEYWYKVQACDADGNTSDFSNTVDTEELFTEVHYGLLYNWYAVDTGLLAPIGWHVPTQTEWTTLGTFLGGIAIAGGHLKEIGTIYWNAPNTGADNSAGFYGRGAGTRLVIGTFSGIKNSTSIWASTEIAGFGDNNKLTCTDTKLEYNISDKKVGYSVRLIKDDAVDPGAVIDYDGNAYPTVTIGTQVWMAQNLIVKHYNDGTPIPEVTDNATWAGLVTGARCYYNNDSSYM